MEPEEGVILSRRVRRYLGLSALLTLSWGLTEQRRCFPLCDHLCRARQDRFSGQRAFLFSTAAHFFEKLVGPKGEN